MFSEAENVMEYYFPFYYLFSLIPCLILIVSLPTVVTTTANTQFRVYRIHQIDMPHGNFGSRSSTFNLEAITPGHISDSFIRKCAIFKLDDLLKDDDLFVNKVLSQSLVSAVLIIYDDLKITFTEQEIRTLHSIEKKLLTNETNLPIYLIQQNSEINQLYEEYSNTQETSNPSFYDFLLKNIFIDSHQLVITGPQTSSINNAIVSNLQVRITNHFNNYSILFQSEFLLTLLGETCWCGFRRKTANLCDCCSLR